MRVECAPMPTKKIYPYNPGMFARVSTPKRVRTGLARRMGTAFLKSPRFQALLTHKGGAHV